MTKKFGLLLLVCASQAMATPVGLNTRDQNPMFQAYYLPSIDLNFHQGWQVSHSVSLTSAFQSLQLGNEMLLIDAENYRYDFSVGYQQKKWRLSAQLPLIFNQGGTFDHAIEDWHSFFGLPQGGRLSHPHNELNINYTKNGHLLFNQTEATNDIGDVAVSLSYTLANTETDLRAISFAIDLPTGSEETISGNEAVDFALWLSQAYKPSHLSRLYGLLGVSLPGKGGQLESLQTSTIWVGQIGLEYALYTDWNAIVQFDAHTAFIEDSQLRPLGNSLQVQIGLRVIKVTENYDVDLFFSEDISVGSAPDITIGFKLYRHY